MLSNIEKQDGILARRIQARIDSSWSRFKAGDSLAFPKYLDIMADLKYRVPGD